MKDLTLSPLMVDMLAHIVAKYPDWARINKRDTRTMYALERRGLVISIIMEKVGPNWYRYEALANECALPKSALEKEGEL